MHKILFKVIYRKEKTHVDIDFYKRNNFLSLGSMYDYELLLLAYKIKFLKHELPTIFQNYLTPQMNRQLRSKNNFQLPFFKTSTAQKQSIYQMSKKWNQLPNEFKTITSFTTFKHRVKSYLLNSMIDI